MSIAELLRQEGRQEGILQSRRDDVIEVLELRVTSVPDGLLEAIGSITSENKLRKLHRTAIQSPDIEAFSKSL